jgi:hypothetical protein
MGRLGPSVVKRLTLIVSMFCLAIMFFWCASGAVTVIFGREFFVLRFLRAIGVGADLKPNLGHSTVRPIDHEPSKANLLPLEHPVNPYADVDAYACRAGAGDVKTVGSLAAYLQRVSNPTDARRARAAFFWVAANIAYDTRFMEAARPELVLHNRRAVCAGYAELLKALCQKMKLECETVTGRVQPEIALQVGETDKHAWNAMKIEGAWQLVDVTWASQKTGVREGFFIVPPEQFIETHYPSHSSWQFMEGRLWTESEFDAPRPKILPEFYLFGLRLGSHKGRDIRVVPRLILWFQVPNNGITYQFSAGVQGPVGGKVLNESDGGKPLVSQNGKLPDSNRYELAVDLPARIPVGSELIIYANEGLNSGGLWPVVVYKLVNN